MKNKVAILPAVLLSLTAAFHPNAASAQTNSPTDPADIGSPVKSLIELGSVYPSLYEITVTVLETVRGAGAMKVLREADPGNAPPKPGFEYVLARVKFEMKRRNPNDNLPFDLGRSPLQWVAFSSDMLEYEGVSVTVPKPPLEGIIRPDQAVEGWVAFAVEQSESKPVMVFDPDSGGASGRGKPLFFKLY
jgi:hypothetical protein